MRLTTTFTILVETFSNHRLLNFINTSKQPGQLFLVWELSWRGWVLNGPQLRAVICGSPQPPHA